MAEKACIRCGATYTTTGGRTYWCEPCKTERFWDSVGIRSEDECWPWVGSTKAHGYGMFYRGHEEWLAHVFAYVQTYGRLEPGECVLHACDTPPCCNPSHLFKGTRGFAPKVGVGHYKR